MSGMSPNVQEEHRGKEDRQQENSGNTSQPGSCFVTKARRGDVGKLHIRAPVEDRYGKKDCHLPLKFLEHCATNSKSVN